MSALHAAQLAALCAAVVASGLWQAAGDSPTIDEPVYLSAGLTALERHDLRLNPQHPPLAKVLAALAALPVAPRLPGGAAWAHPHERAYARAFLTAARSAGNLRLLTFLSRAVPVLELAATALLVYALARRLGGQAGGLFAAGMWVLDPFVLGMGHVDGIDLPFTLATLAVVLALTRWLDERTIARAVPVGLACGLALVIRDTAPLLLAAALVTVAVAARDIRQALTVLALAGAVVWLVYGMLDPAYTIHEPNLLPQRYIDGFDALADAHGGPRAAFLLGHQWGGSHWWFWPASMAIKLPASLLVAFALTPLVVRKALAAGGRAVLLAALPAAALLAAFTVATPTYLGLRYMLPVIALLTVAVAPLARARRVLPAALLAVSLGMTAASLPHSIAWTAPPFHPGYRAVTDSNLDWGQDVYGLQRWARGRSPWIACYSPKGVGCADGVRGAHRLGKHAEPRRVHGWVAISSTLLNLDNWDPWLRRMKPAGTIDGTVLLYRLPGRA